MDKRKQLRELTAFDQRKHSTRTFLSAVFATLLFFSLEYNWLSPMTVIFLSIAAGLPDFRKMWQRENIKKQFLKSDAAKRLIHLNSIFGLVTLPFFLVWIYALLTDWISLQAFALIGLGAYMLAILEHRLYERHMAQLDEHYVTEAELREEQKWGSA
ncbi:MULTISPECIES: hypothetical protein [unclassified Exiguobacterium]|uniref:hypothetical protein n=1 Tax=unclassified Exiguobacterium TaxID=2644629 RepID=UPI00103C4697|nr:MULTISPECIES: hypothetical protein [unclassified Exiguobacterium]TCI76839.1 hypothetical protein EVJ18_13130 [Exiguobacterium sp. IPCH1]TCI78584.1 hypothetical protein EVJ17_13130 [Exiguobacterium sp. IPBC4]